MSLTSEEILALSPEKLRELAGRLRGATGIPRVPRPRASFEASSAQQRLWFLDRLHHGSSAYHVPAVMRIDGALDEAALRWSLDEIVRRHEILRTTFRPSDDGPVQIVHDTLALPLPSIEVTDDELLPLAEAELRRPFDLERGPLVRATLLRARGGERLLVLVLHHIIADGWSLGVLFGELAALYEARCSGVAALLPEPKLQYADYAAWQRGRLRDQSLGAQLDYWRRQLGGELAPLDFLPDGPRPAEQTFRGARERSVLGDATAAELRRFCAAEGVTPFMTLLAAFYAVLHRSTGRTDICVGSPVAGRTTPEFEPLAGLFVNTLVLREDLGGDPPFRTLVHRVRRTVLDALDHQDVPFERIVEELQPARSMSHSPLFQVELIVQNMPLPRLQSGGMTLTPLPVDPGTSRFDLSFQFLEWEGRFDLEVSYATDLFTRDTIRTLIGHFQRLLAAGIRDAATRVSALPLLAAEEEHVLLHQWNATRVDRPFVPVIDRFEEQAERTPDAIALTSGEATLTYAQLDRAANRLAHRLADAGAAPERVVAIRMERSAEMVVAILAILKTGAAWMPIDPDTPAERAEWMLAESRAVLALARADVSLDAGEDTAPPHRALAPDTLAYVIYTSGSTGRPKGVMSAHGPLANRIAWMQEQYGLDASDRVLQKTPLTFDVSVWELVWPLATGARLVLASPGAPADAAALVRTIETEGVTVLHFVPSLLRLFLERPDVERCRSLRLLVASGEALPEDLCAEAAARLGCRIENLYGPTEAAIDVTSWTCDGGPVAIGRPIANARIYLLDAHLRPVPRGAAGQLFIAGPVLARGYIGAPSLTAAAFLPDPWGKPGARMYATGDLARWRPDRNLQYLGRADAQIKLHGIRLEPEEIEAQLRRHPAVRDAAVVAQPDARGELRLAAHVVAAAAVPRPSELRDFLSATLPQSHVPGTYRFVAELPRTASGKVDRKALAAGAPAAGIALDAEEPRTAAEKTLAAIWRDLLGLGRIGRHAHFFEAGGHSLLAFRLIARVRDAFGVDLPLRELFRAPSLAALAAAIEARGPAGERAAAPVIIPDPAHRGEPFPLNEVQEAYWIGRRGDFQLGDVAAHLYVEVDCRGVEPAAIGDALDRLIRRHDMLRCVVDADGRQRILAEVPRYEMPVRDLRDQTPAAVAAALETVRGELAHQVLPSDRWPLFDIRATRLGDQVRLHMSLDLLIGDALSWLILCRELGTLARDPDASLPPLALSFRDYVLAEQALRESDERRRALAYWDARLDTLPGGPDLPLARAATTRGGGTFRRRSGELSPENWRRLGTAATAAGVTPSVLLMTAFADVLALWSATPRFTLNVTLFNRLPLHAEVDDLVGDFTSLTLLEVDGERGTTFLDRVRQVQLQLWDDLDHRQAGGVEVLRRLARRRGEPVLMPVVFSSILPQLGRGEDTRALQHLGEVVYGITQTPQIYLDHQVYEHEGALRYNWDSIDELFPPALWDDVFASYERLLRRLVDDPAAWHDLSPASIPDAHLRLIEEANATGGPVSDALLHELFTETAARTPDALAAISPARALTYRELDAESDRLARLLSDAVHTDELIAIVMHPGVEQSIAALAVMKAGGTWLPIDPESPRERLWHLLERGRTAVVLTQAAIDRAMAWPEGLRRVCVDAGEHTAAGASPIASRRQPDDLAYVMFTSGSTGIPKGVAIPHRGAVNTCLDVNDRFGVDTNDRILNVSRFTFDLSVYDLFGTFAAGAAVVIPDPWRARDPEHWLELILDRRVTVWSSAPPLASMLVEWLEAHDRHLGDDLRLVLLSGDWIPVDLPDRLRALAPHARMISLGGATEASIWSIAYPIEHVDPAWTSIPYGRAMRNQHMFVLDHRRKYRPLFATGEIYIGGIGLAHGYWRDDAQTRERFVTSAETGERLYATGDVGRLLPDGDIEFLGRLDSQVKIRGHRVELGEIESVLRAHEHVQDAVVVARGDRHARQLAAFVVARAGASPDAAELREHLATHLPHYMIPPSIQLVGVLPLNRSGKIDRGALAALAPAPEVPFPAATGPLDLRIASWVAEVLGVPHVDPSADLLALGVTSVDMVRVANVLWKHLGHRVRFDDFYREPTVAAIARGCAGEEGML
ncbi:MAG TPA: amino acid adenylation domain-containing protein [Thermoanaerobaculia bacterium]